MQKEMLYKYKEVDYKVVITYKMMRSITYRVRNNVIYISAPYLTSTAKLIDGLNKFAPRLLKDRNLEPPYSDNYIYVLGKKYFLNSESKVLKIESENIYIIYKDITDLLNKLDKWLLSYMIIRTKYYENLMHTQQHNVHIKHTVSRFGSISPMKKSVNYNAIMKHYSSEIIDSLIVHELSHCYQMNHSKDFYAIVYKYCPNYKELDKKLKKGIYE